MEMNETEQLQKGLQRFQPSFPFRVGAPLGELVEKAIEKDPRIVYYVESWEVSSTPGYYVLIPKYRNRETKRETIETALSQWDCERLMREYVRQYKKKLVMISKDVVKAQRLIELFYERYTTFYPNLTRICGATYPCRAGAVIIEFSFEYRIGQVRLEQMELEVNTEVQRISRMLFTPGMPTEAKVYLAHNYLATTVEYLKNHDNRLKMSYTQSAYGALIRKKCVCQGFAEAFKRLMDAAGIACDVLYGQVTGSDGYHAWNLVCVGGAGSYYHIDVTWDAGDKRPGYTYFCKNDRFFDGKRTWKKEYTHPCKGSYPVLAVARRYVQYNKAALLAKGIDAAVLDC